MNTRATVTLQVNGQQAERTLQQLKSNALQLESAIAKAAAAGNKTDLKRLRRELADTKRQIREVESSTMQVERVMARLDRATPRELSRTLTTLNKQLDYMERGSEAWKAHARKIQAVKAELGKVNDELRVTESRWTRFNRVINDWQTSIMGAAAAVTGLIMAGRSAVSSFAEMDEELANTRKYTGMAEKDVEELNEVFKKMDTRTPREKLNELAQEAGRLGKNTLESVQGYVEAADIINVALVDLGDGATQTIAKLSNIFGIEETMSTKDAMLSVGSAVNVLSQNCTASKQYLVEFTQRMAGVGAQADLTIPQLLAFGATLDANGQKTEMSASALGKLTMMLFQKPGEVAQQVGLDVEKFTEALKKSTNDGLIMFLERIQQLGSKDGLAVLAPLFKDLGMDGVRMSQVLATLAEHLDMVKWEQEEANKAFNEATSATHEYEIFNNTVQAGLDKARKRINELAIELGQKLMPIMSHVMTSTSLILRLLNTTVDFIKKYGTEIAVVTAAFVAYKVAVNASNIVFKAHYALLATGQALTAAYTAVVKGLTAAKIALQMIMAKLNGNWARQSSLMLDAKKAGVSLATGYGIIAAAAIALTYVFVKLYQRMTELSQAEKDMMEIRRKGQESIAEEKRKIESLVAVARDEKASLDDRKAAINALNQIIPKYNAQLDATTGKYRENKAALDDYLRSLARKYEIEGAKEMLIKIGKERAQLAVDEEYYKKEEARIADQRKKRAANPYNYATTQGGGAPSVVHESMGESATLTATRNELDRRKKVLDQREAVIMGAYGKDIQKSDVQSFTPPKEQPVTTTPPSGGGSTTVGGGNSGGGNTGSGGSSSRGNIFEKEDAWKKEQEAYARIDYATGKKNHREYTDRLLEIEVEYNKKRLENKQATQAELLQVDAAYHEAVKKQTDAASEHTIEDEKKAHELRLVEITQFFADGKIDQKAYEAAIEKEELDHAKAMVRLTKEGTKECLEAEKQYAELQAKAQQKRLKETEDAEKKAAEDRKKMKEKFFGNNPAENKALFDADMAVLKAVYNAELKAAEGNAKEKLRIEKAYHEARIALMKQYNIEGANENLNFMQNMSEDITEFLDSEGGRAIIGATDTIVNSMSGIFTQLSSMVQSELQIQTARLEKRYDREIALAEGNRYKTVKLEKQREEEIAKLKNEANKKLFAMQVVQAIASTALSAINAYSSAAQVPYVGYILAPIAAAAAVAAGALQIASIKKQQQASEAQGYMSGGFTREGAVDEVAGVVHAGEWVASQKLVRDPRTRPILEALDHAQRTNMIGSLSAEDVSSTITAPTVLAKSSLAAQSVPQRVIIENDSNDSSAVTSSLERYSETIDRLSKRLNEPFITVNSVTGENGMLKAQEEYDKLLRNKTPKSRRL